MCVPPLLCALVGGEHSDLSGGRESVINEVIMIVVHYENPSAPSPGHT